MFLFTSILFSCKSLVKITLKVFTSTLIRSSCLQIFFKIGGLENFAIFTGKHLCWSLFLIKFQPWSLLNKVPGLKACNFIKERLHHRCFPVNIAKLLRKVFFIEHLRWLLLVQECHCSVFVTNFHFFVWNIFNFFCPRTSSEVLETVAKLCFKYQGLF